MAKRKTLTQLTAERVPRKGMSPWEESISIDLRAELEEAYQDYKAGKRGTKTGFCRALSAALAECGHAIGHAGVEGWLKRRQARG